MIKRLIVFCIIIMLVLSHIILLLQIIQLKNKDDTYNIRVKEIKKITIETKLYQETIIKINELEAENQLLEDNIETLNKDININQENIKNYNNQTTYYNNAQ